VVVLARELTIRGANRQPLSDHTIQSRSFNQQSKSFQTRVGNVRAEQRFSQFRAAKPLLYMFLAARVETTMRPGHLGQSAG
jgi:hypothetical protein